MSAYTDRPWMIEFEPDDLESKNSRLRIIDGSPESLNHPQGPLVLATLNVSAFAPHLAEPLANADLMVAAPAMLAALQRLVSPHRTEADIESARVLIDGVTNGWKSWRDDE